MPTIAKVTGTAWASVSKRSGAAVSAISRILGQDKPASGPTTLVLDEFTDTASTNLTAHTVSPTNTPGNSWATLAGSGCRIYSDGAQAEAAANGSASSVECSDADVTVSADFVTDDAGTRSGYLYFRVVDSSNYWRVLISDRDGANQFAFFIQKNVAGSLTDFYPASYGGSNQDIIGGTTYNVKVVLNGSSIKAYNGSTLVLDITDSAHSTATKHGIGSERPKAAYGALIDNFKVTTP